MDEVTGRAGEAAPARVDVLVATRDRPLDLRRLLRSMGQQTHPHFTLVIIDQSESVAANRDAVEAARDDRIVHVPDPARGKSRALNSGLRSTHAPLIAFTDDDCEPARDWLERLLQTMDTHSLAGLVFGDVVPADHDPAIEFVPAIRFGSVRSLGEVRSRAIGLMGMGANMMLRRTAAVDVGLFDEDLGPGGVLKTGEDVELAYRMRRRGWEVIQDPLPTVVHRGARRWEGGYASDSVNIAFSAIASGYGKHARSGDARAVQAMAAETASALAAMGCSVAARRPPYHFRRLTRLATGFLSGVRLGPNWPLFTTTGAT